MSSHAQLFLIDGSSQMYRAYHAIRGLSGPDGRSTNAIYGFVTMLRKLLADHHPEFIAAAFDLPAPTFRSGLSAEYKKTRAPMPPDLAEQVPFVHEACRALGVPIITHTGFEADDVIGTLAAQACDRGMTVALVTGDKDFFQLVTPCVLVFNPRDEGTWYDPEGVQARLGVRPDQVVDVLALMGDTIDNVKGVPGIGDKGARDLISTWGSLDALLEHAAEVPQRKYREALLANAESARQSRELVRIRTNVPIVLEPDALRFSGANRTDCFELFTRLGFRTLTSEYAPTPSTIETDYATVSTRETLESLAHDIRQAGHVALHVLLDPPAGLDARPLGLAFSFRAGQARWLPVTVRRGAEDPIPGDAPSPTPPPPTGNPQQNLFGGTGADGAAAPSIDVIGDNDRWPWEVVLEVLGPVLGDPSIGKSVHDWKTAALAIEGCGGTLAGLAEDTMLASYVLDANRSSHAIEPVALDALGYKAVEAEDVCGKGVKAVGMDTLPGPTLRAYGCERADLVQRLTPMFVDSIESQQLSRVYRELELPLVPVLVDIERAGIALDRDVLHDLAIRVDRDLEAKQRRIFELAGLDFNINSPKQLAEVLFDKLQLPAPKKTGRAKATSTGVEVLEELAQVHEIPREILDWRALAKLKGTYIDALPLLVRPATGRLHTTFNQAVAATGRLSSSDPNLQNIPIRTELGREIRRAFIAPPGHRLVSADYSQIELRVLAHLSRDENLVDAFTQGEDIHDRTAIRVFGAESGLDPYELRRRAKIINYALLYGKTAFTLAKDIGVTQQAAQEFINAYFDGFPAVRRFIDETLARAREQGFVATMWGRRRKLPEITSRNGAVRSAAERIAVNMPIQGSAADILKRAMIDVHRAFARDPACAGARMILTVHDELLFEVPEGSVDHAAQVVRTCMEGAVRLNVPLTVDLGVGKNWMEAK